MHWQTRSHRSTVVMQCTSGLSIQGTVMTTLCVSPNICLFSLLKIANWAWTRNLLAEELLVQFKKWKSVFLPVKRTARSKRQDWRQDDESYLSVPHIWLLQLKSNSISGDDMQNSSFSANLASEPYNWMDQTQTWLSDDSQVSPESDFDSQDPADMAKQVPH